MKLVLAVLLFCFAFNSVSYSQDLDSLKVHFDAEKKQQEYYKKQFELRNQQSKSDNKSVATPVIATEKGSPTYSKIKQSIVGKLNIIENFISKVGYWFKNLFSFSFKEKTNIVKSSKAAPSIFNVTYDQLTDDTSSLIRFRFEYADVNNNVSKIEIDFGDGKIVEFDASELPSPVEIDHIYSSHEHFNFAITVTDSAMEETVHTSYVELQGLQIPKMSYEVTPLETNLLKVLFKINTSGAPVMTGCPGGPINLYSFWCEFPSAGTYPLQFHIRKSEHITSYYESEITVGGGVVTSKPFAIINADNSYGLSPLTVNFNANDSFDLDGEIVSYEWNFGDASNPGNVSKENEATKTFYAPGSYYVQLKLKDNNGNESIQYKHIIVRDPHDREAMLNIINLGGLSVGVHTQSSLPFTANDNHIYWDFGDGTKKTGWVANHTYALAGTYVVKMKAVSVEGRVYEQEKTIEITILNDTPVSKISADKTMAMPYDSIHFTSDLSSDPGGSDPLEYSWRFLDGSNDFHNDEYFKIFEQLGLQTGELIVTNSRGFSNISRFTVEIVSELGVLIPRITFDPKIGTGTMTVNFDGSASTSKAGKVVAHEWMVDGNIVSLKNKGSVEVSGLGHHDIKYIATDSLGNQAVVYDKIIINGPTPPGNNNPVAVISSLVDSNDPRLIYFNCSSSTDTDDQVAFCEWSLNGKPLTVGFFSQVTLPENKNYILELRVVDNWGASSTVRKVFDFREQQESVMAFDYSPLNPIINQPVTFGSEQAVINGAKIVSFNWNFGDSTSGSGAIVKHNYTSTGSYVVTLTITDEFSNTFNVSQNIQVYAGESSTGLEIYARPANIAGRIRSTQTYRSFSSPETIRFEVLPNTNAAGTAHDTTWNFGDGNTGFGESIDYTYHRPGTFTVTASTKTKNNTTINASMTIIIVDARTCMDEDPLSTCLRLDSGMSNTLPMGMANWEISSSAGSISSTPTGKWIKLKSADERDNVEIDISDAALINAGKIILMREKVLEKNIDLSKPYRIWTNFVNAGSLLSGKTPAFYFGYSRLTINTSESDVKLEVVNTPTQMRRFYSLIGISSKTFVNMPAGPVVVVATKGNKKVIKTVTLSAGQSNTLNIDMDQVSLRKKKNKSASLKYLKNNNDEDNLPSWTNGLCGEPSPFQRAQKSSQSNNEVFAHKFSSVDPSAQYEFKALSRTTPRPTTLSCGITTPALLFGQNKWKYKEGPKRCDGENSAHPYWNEYLKNLKREDSPVVVAYEIKDGWTQEIIKGHFITSANDIMMKNELQIGDLTSKIGIGTSPDQDWALKMEHLLPIPTHFRRPEVKFDLISDHNASDEDFYQVQCHIIENKVKPMVSRLGLFGLNSGVVHSQDVNARFTLDQQYNYFPVHYDNTASSATTYNAEAGKLRYTATINYHDYKGITWQGVEIEYLYDDQTYTKFYPSQGVYTQNYLENNYVDSFIIDTVDLYQKFTWIPGVRKIYLKVTPIGKITTNYDFRGEAKKFPFTALFDLKTVAAEYPVMCPEGFYPASVTSFVRDELLSSLILGANSGVNLRCGDASAPFGGPFDLVSTWRYVSHRHGNDLFARSQNITGSHDSYDDFSGVNPNRRSDVEQYISFSNDAKLISQITSETTFRKGVKAFTDKKKLFDFCHPVSGEALPPCNMGTTFNDLDHDMVLKICQWNMADAVMPEGCPVVDASKIIRFASWVEMNSTPFNEWTKVSPLKMLISGGRYNSPLNAVSPLDWQKLALVNGRWPDGKPIWRSNGEKKSLVSERAAKCHESIMGCDGLIPFFTEDSRYFNKMSVQTGWR